MLPGQSTAVIERLRAAGCVQRIPVHFEPGVTGALQEASGLVLEMIGPVPLPMMLGTRKVDARWYVASPTVPERGAAERCDHVSVVAFGEPDWAAGPPLVRIHSTCFTGDVLGSLRCDCGPQLASALEQMSQVPEGGMVVYMAGHEGRGIGLWAKAAAYLLQDEGLDTYEANRALGFEDDQRDFRYGAAVIRHLLGTRHFRLLTNNPEKVAQLRRLGLANVVRESHVAGVSASNRRYLCAKVERGHPIPLAALADIRG